MSRSPRDALTISLNSDYLQATRMLDRMGRAGFSWSGNEKDVALLNTGRTGGGRFADISGISGFNSPGDGRAAGLTDWDGDGDMDVWVMNRTAPQIRFLENSTRSGAGDGPGFLMLRLEGDGKKCSREATGARAELVLSGNAPRLLRAVHTGDTHCSQSSRWLHFGLGDARVTIQKLIVCWPDGAVEEFPGLEPNRRYDLKRGGKPAVRAHSQKKTESVVPPPAPAEPPPAGLTVYSNRLPPPPLEWNDFDGKPHALSEYKGRSVALLLWASWCSNCREELKTLAARAAKLKQAGVTLVALNIDAATTDNGGDPARARAAWPNAAAASADSGEASPALMGRLESFHGALHWIGGPLRIPGLFLLDSEGRLVAHGEGCLEDAAWEKALTALAAPQEKWMDLALPFPGSRYGRVASIRMADVPQHLLEDDAIDLAAEYLAAHGPLLEAAARAKQEPGYARVLYTLGVHLTGTGRKTEAIQQYRKAIELKPAYIDARYNLAGLLWETGERSKALDQYTTLISNAPGHAASWHNRAMMRQESGDLEGAAEDYRQALARAPGSLDSLNNLGNTLVALKREEEALPIFEQALAAAPGDARTHYNQALALEQSVRWADAAAAYRRAITLDPQNAQYVHNLGVLFARQARWDEAGEFLNRALELQPDHPTAARNLKRVREMKAGTGR